MKQVQEVQSWKQVRGSAGAVKCETRDLGIKWPHWRTLIFEGKVRIDIRYVCPKRCEANDCAADQDSLLEEVGSEAWM